MSIFVKIARTLLYPNYSKKVISTNLVNRLQKCSRNVHCSTSLSGKMYQEYENKYAYNILQSKGYAISLDSNTANLNLNEKQFQEILQSDWPKKSHLEVFEVFPKLGAYCSGHNLCISNTMFDDYIDCLTDHIQQATDKQLKDLFYALNKWPETRSIRTRNIIEVWVALDDECIKRMKEWSNSELLSYVALFYMLNVSRNSDFTTKCLNKLASKAKQLTAEELVQTLFFIGISRRSPFDMHNLEIELNNRYLQFSIEELAIMSMGFFKSKTPIRNQDLVLKIVNSVIQHSKEIHEVSLAALLKIIRYSTKIPLDDRIYRLLDILQHEVPRLSVMCNVHLALVGTSSLNLHEQCLVTIAENVNKLIEKARIKDLERLVLTYGTFNLKPKTEECFFTKVINELRKPERLNEINTHGRSFACCVAYLGILGIYPTDLINTVLSQEFLEKTYGKQVYYYGREVLAIHDFAELFCSDTKMNLLDTKLVKVMAKRYTDYIPREDYKKQYNVTERMVLDIMKILKDRRGGEEFVTGDHLLPHHQRGDIIICNDHNGSPLPVIDMFPAKDFGTVRKPPDNKQWIVLVVAGRNALIYNTDTATGFFNSKVNELEALGYNAILVPWSLYSKLETADEKAFFLNDLIEKSVKKQNIRARNY
ncbi:unnamed protein product [Chrysodeixis includens]|uniref:RAP domain-containing protein n=1 Tax=Chrysodeixis includens TaxID=689277 RepID=A0A9P0C262_CHRIL|nr:unnamed protein product [Chrysodeixis includens]